MKRRKFIIMTVLILFAVGGCSNNNGDVEPTGINESNGKNDEILKISVGGKDYTATHFGEQDLTPFDIGFIKREFWRLENAYDDFKNNALTGDKLPYHNYPAGIETGQVFVIDYTEIDGTVSRKYYRSDGTVWHDGSTVTEEFVLQ